MWERCKVSLDYQPIVRNTGDIVAYEALLRLIDDTGHHYLPHDFMNDIVSSGLLNDLTLDIINEAVAWGKAWSTEVAVNLSSSQINTVGDDIIDHLDGLWGIEITESAPSGNAVEEFITHVHRAGNVKVMIDDFGVKWSNLETLTRLDVDVVKIDRSVVNGGAQRDAVVRGVVDIAGELDMTVVAEGVQDEWVARSMLRLGVCGLQGWWLARENNVPLSDETVKKLRRRVASLSRR